MTKGPAPVVQVDDIGIIRAEVPDPRAQVASQQDGRRFADDVRARPHRPAYDHVAGLPIVESGQSTPAQHPAVMLIDDFAL